MDIPAASLDQLRQARNGQWVTVPAKEGGVARDLKDVDENLRLRRSETNGIYVVYQVLDNGDEHLVTTSTACDQRLVSRVRQISSSSYDFLGEIQRLDAQYEKDQDHARREQNGELGERLLHSLQTDIGVQNTVHMGDRVGSRAKRKGLK